MGGCFWANVLAVFEAPHPFTLNTAFGALADGLGCSPLGRGTYLPQPDSLSRLGGIRGLIWIGSPLRPRTSSVPYLRQTPSRG